jgi:hypothetical protein
MMENQPQQQRRTSWIMLASILILVGGLLTTWALRFDDGIAYDRAHGQPVDFHLGNVQATLDSLGNLWDQKFGAASSGAVGDEQNQGQMGQLTNAGLTNEQIDTIENDLFENTAPQQ